MAYRKNNGAGPAKGTLEYFEAQSKNAQLSWFTLIALTVVNTLMVLFSESATIFFFSSWLPLDQSTGALLLYQSKEAFATPLIIAAVFFVAMLLAAVLWKKSLLWPVVAVVLYAIDCLYIVGSLTSEAVGYLYLNDAATGMVVFHVVILALLIWGFINALKAKKARQAAAEMPAFTAPQPSADENSTDAHNYKGPEL